MANFNRVVIAGNLTRDVELKYTPKGTAVAKLGMALNRSWTDDSGARKEEVTYVDVDAFGKQAEVLAQYLAKGRSLLVEGRLKLESWDDKATGQKRSKLGVVMESFSFLDAKGADNAGSKRPADATAQGNSVPSAKKPAMDDDTDNVHF